MYCLIVRYFIKFGKVFLPFFFDNENGKTFEKDEISEKDFFGKESERGAGAFGSTSTR